MDDETTLMTSEPAGDFISQFLDLPIEQKRRGIYVVDKLDASYIEDIEESGFTYRVLRPPTEEVLGRIAIEAPGVSVAEVFSSAHATLATYVANVYGGAHDAALLMVLKQPGQHFVLHGPSKVGKTQLWKAVLGSDAVPVPCGGVKQLETLYAHALFRLNSPHLVSATLTDEMKSGKSLSLEGNLGSDKIGGLAIGAELTNEEVTTQERQMAYESQPNQAIAIADAFAKRKKHLILENFHRLPAELLEPLAHDLRVFSDQGVSVVLVGIPEDPYILNTYDNELMGRISYLSFTWWSLDDLRRIGELGSIALRVRFSEPTLEMLTAEAAGSPLLMQEFCLIACLASGITEWSEQTQQISAKNEDLGRGIQRWLSNRLAPYSACKKVFAECATRSALNDSAVSYLLQAPRRDATMSVASNEVPLSVNRAHSLRSFIDCLNSNARTKDLLALVDDEQKVAILDPSFYVYLRWLA
jgi:hypothetical protein